MPKRPPYIEGHCYHLYNRGAHRVSIFREPENYLFVLRNLKAYGRSLRVTTLAYALLPNHYHLVVRQDGDTPAGLLIQRVFNRYSKAYNARYDHSGTLFEGNYRVKHVQNAEYLTRLCIYVHTNPVKHQFADTPSAWPYTNYHECIAARRGTLVDHGWIEEYFGGPDGYRAAVEQYLAEQPAHELPGAAMPWADP